MFSIRPTLLVKLSPIDCSHRRPEKVNGIVLRVFIRSFALRHPHCRASIRTLCGPLVGPVHVGVRLNPQVPSLLDGTWGCWGCHLSRDLKDQRSERSHPNKAADVVLVQLREKVLVLHTINFCLL